MMLESDSSSALQLIQALDLPKRESSCGDKVAVDPRAGLSRVR